MYLCIHVHVYIFMHLSMYFSLFLWDWSWNSWLQNEPLSLFLLRGFPNYLPVSDCQLSPPICCPDVLGKQGRALECLDELSEAPLHCTDPAVASGLGRPCHRASKARTWGTRRAALLRSGPAPVSEVSVAGLHSSDQVPQHLLLQPLWLWGDVIQEAMRASSQAPLRCQPGNHWWSLVGRRANDDFMYVLLAI
jgi:hypothetical protein